MVKNGSRTSELVVTLIGMVSTGVVPLVILLFIMNGAISPEEGEIWRALVAAVLAIVATVVPIVIGSQAKTYTAGRVRLKSEAMSYQAAHESQLMTMGVNRE